MRFVKHPPVRRHHKRIWRNRFHRRKNFPCISREYSEAPRFLKAKSSAAEIAAEFSAAEDLAFRKRGASEYFLEVSFVTIQLLLLHFHYFHQSNFYSHYNIYASSYGSFRIRVSLVIKDIGKIFSAAEVIFLVLVTVYSAAEAQGFRVMVWVSLVIRYIGKNIFRRRSNFSCACDGIFRRRNTRLLGDG